MYGKLVKDTYIIKDKDRVEIYEKIIADPKINRKKRASYEESIEPIFSSIMNSILKSFVQEAFKSKYDN